MASVCVERLDHLGVVASVIKDLGLINMIDKRLVPNAQEVITPGEAVAGMILNGLGFAHRPLSLTPQFFANKPLDLLFRPGISDSRRRRILLKINDLPHMTFVNIKSIESTTYAFYAIRNAASFELSC